MSCKAKVARMVEASSLPNFGDFDDRDVYGKCYEAALHRDTTNFVVEFDSTKAYAAHNLTDASMKHLLQVEVIGFPCIHAVKDDTG